MEGVGLDDMEHFAVAAGLVQIEVLPSENLAGVAEVEVEAVGKMHY